MNCICLEPPPDLLGQHYMELRYLQSPFCSERQTGGWAQGDWMQGCLFSCTAHSLLTRSSAKAPGPPPPPWHLSHLGEAASCSPWCDSSGWWLPRAANSIHMETLRRGNMAVPRKCLIFLMVSISQTTRDRKHGRCLCGTPDVHQTHITAAFHSTTRAQI